MSCDIGVVALCAIWTWHMLHAPNGLPGHVYSGRLCEKIAKEYDKTSAAQRHPIDHLSESGMFYTALKARAPRFI